MVNDPRRSGPEGAGPTQSGQKRVGPGALILIVGPSGAGKDTVMRQAMDGLSGTDRIRFARRIITRTADNGSEDHDSVSEDTFENLVGTGGAALHWRAHGLGYALPIKIDTWIAEGETVVANTSRRMIEAAAARYERVVVVHVTAPPEILAQRLEARGRETAADILERLQTVPLSVPEGVTLTKIVNDTTPEAAGDRLIEAIARTADALPAIPR